MAAKANSSRRPRGFLATLGWALDAQYEFERLNHMSDRSLAAMHLTRNQIPQYIASRL